MQLPVIKTKSNSMDDLDKKQLSFEFKSVDTETNIFEGYASTFGGDPDFDGDVVEKGAFTKTIQERGDDIKILWQHNWNEPIGKAIELREDEIGLYIKAKISDTPRGREAIQLMKDGVINRMSIGYSVVKKDFNYETGVRTLKEVKLYEVSAVTFPANPKAMITGAKNEKGNDSLKSFIDNVIEDFKAGKVLSDKNKTLVTDAIKSMSGAVESLQALLDATDNNDSSKNEEIDEFEAKELADLINSMKSYATQTED